jgi:hypothetical protein
MNEVEEHQLIYSMCLTYQHDYGMWPDEERKALYRNMESVYRHNIKPLFAKPIEKQEIPKDIDRALFIGKFHCEENVDEVERICDEADTPHNQYKEQAYNMRKVLDKFKNDLQYMEKVCKKYGVYEG